MEPPGDEIVRAATPNQIGSIRFEPMESTMQHTQTAAIRDLTADELDIVSGATNVATVMTGVLNAGAATARLVAGVVTQLIKDSAHNMA
jgi:hypothetical protein